MRGIVFIFIYLGVLFTAVQGAAVLRSWSLDKLYAHYDKNSATISITRLHRSEITQILSIAKSDIRVRKNLDIVNTHEKYINYIVPTDWSASEIPMHQIEGFDHFGYQPPDNPRKHKVVFTRSIPDTSKDLFGKQIIEHSKDRLPVLEIVVDTDSRIVSKIIYPAETDALEAVSLPTF